MIINYVCSMESAQDYLHHNISNLDTSSGYVWAPPRELPASSYRHILHLAFRQQDKIIGEHSSTRQQQPWRPGVVAGAHALLSFYDSRTRLLRVAVLGSARALLGRRTKTADGKTIYEVHALSVDQNMDDPRTVALLDARHPGESLVKNGRIFGRRSINCFGDMPFKWSRKTTAELQQKYPTVVKGTPEDVLTPPYFTVDPEITTTSIQPGESVAVELGPT